MGSTPHNGQKALCGDRVFDGRRWHEHSAVLLEAGRIRGIAAQGAIPTDCPTQRLPAGSILAPGLNDLQVNGGGGVLLNDDPSPEVMRAIARAHRAFGTTALLPTLISDTHDKMRRAIAASCAVSAADGILGLHLEGPFLNPARAGAHAREHIRRPETRDGDDLRVLAHAGRSLVTLAPECVPQGFVRALTDAGIRVCAGHSEASAETVLCSVEEGLCGVTHLFNAMPPFQGRAPGVVGAAFAEPRIVAGLIVDGFHVDPVSVRAAFAAKGADGIALVTDAMPTVGATTREFQLAGRGISLHEGRLITADGTLAGAHLDLASAVRNAVTHCGIALEHALMSATLTPARFLGLDHERGALVAGARADLVALDSGLHVFACWFGGMEQGASRQG